jgi:hypothetical protein
MAALEARVNAPPHARCTGTGMNDLEGVMDESTNSRDTRVLPIFEWLRVNGGFGWPARLVQMADGVAGLKCGVFLSMDLETEKEVPPTPASLRWMLENAERLTPKDGRRWRELRERVANKESVRDALESLKTGRLVPRQLVLKGSTHADCLINCEHALIWIEGKRFDWLSPSIEWDVTRDQLLRNVEVVWSLARKSGKDYRMLICHEDTLKHHEISLLEGYRSGTWSAGWPRISAYRRREFATRIGTLTWSEMAEEWPALNALL